MRYIFLAALIVVAAPAWAEWTKYSESDEMVVYGDPTTIQKKGDFSQVLQLLNNKQRNPDGPNSSTMTVEFDCKGNRSRVLSVKSYADQMAKGEVVFEWPMPVGWKDITPGTAEIILNIVCK